MIMVCLNAAGHQHKYTLNVNGVLLYKNSLLPSNKYRNIRFCFKNIIELQNNSQIISLLYTQPNPAQS